MVNGDAGRGTRRTYEQEAAELEAVLASDLFTRAPALSKILRYICEKCFAGEQASIKEYTVAVEALGRSSDFNPRLDSIVRVEASRLRKHLSLYYETEGANHSMRIVLPESGYIPRFVPAGEYPPELDAAPSNALQEQGQRLRTFLRQKRNSTLVIAGLVIIVAAAFVFLGAIGLNKHVFNAIPPNPRPSPPGTSPVPESAEIRILAGLSRPEFVDSLGRRWLSDRHFSGGRPVSRPNRRIFRTRDLILYQTARQGSFQYDIPLDPGVYELHLHFAEILLGQVNLDSDGVGLRRFNVLLNDKLVLPSFDIIADAGGPGVADERVFKDVSPATDGFLHLKFISLRNEALLSGVEVIPGIPGQIHPVRIHATQYTNYDSKGLQWGPDRYYFGGRRVTHMVSLVNTLDTHLYQTVHWGHFSYAIPVAEGTYRLDLRFAEVYFGPSNPGKGGIGSRVFDVYCNGTALLRDFDVFKEAGGENRALVKTFRGLKPNAQGKLMLSFVPVTDYPIICGIEVVDDSES